MEKDTLATQLPNTQTGEQTGFKKTLYIKTSKTNTMKKFLSLLFVAFSFSTALAQVKFTTTFEERDTGKKPTTGTYELMSDYVVIEAEGTALDLYNKTID